MEVESRSHGGTSLLDPSPAERHFPESRCATAGLASRGVKERATLLLTRVNASLAAREASEAAQEQAGTGHASSRKLQGRSRTLKPRELEIPNPASLEEGPASLKGSKTASISPLRHLGSLTLQGNPWLPEETSPLQSRKDKSKSPSPAGTAGSRKSPEPLQQTKQPLRREGSLQSPRSPLVSQAPDNRHSSPMFLASSLSQQEAARALHKVSPLSASAGASDCGRRESAIRATRGVPPLNALDVHSPSGSAWAILLGTPRETQGLRLPSPVSPLSCRGQWQPRAVTPPSEQGQAPLSPQDWTVLPRVRHFPPCRSGDGRRVSADMPRQGSVSRSTSINSRTSTPTSPCGGEGPRLESGDPLLEVSLAASEPSEELKGLVEALKSGGDEEKLEAAKSLRLCTRKRAEAASLALVPGGIDSIVSALDTESEQLLELCVVCLFNMSLAPGAKEQVREAGAIKKLPPVLEGSASIRAKANAAAALFLLIETEEHQMQVAGTPVVQCLMRLAQDNPVFSREPSNSDNSSCPLDSQQGNTAFEGPKGAGSMQSLSCSSPKIGARRDAMLALLKLSQSNCIAENLISSRAVELSTSLIIDGSDDVEEEAAALLASLARLEQGRKAILSANGIAAAVELVESGSAKSKDYAAAMLHAVAFGSREGLEAVRDGVSLPLLGLLEETGSKKVQKKMMQLVGFLTHGQG